MAKTTDEMPDTPPVRALRKFAMRFPEAEEGTSCVRRAFRAGKKAYAYLGMKADQYDLMVKLGESIPIAEAMQTEQPAHYTVGKAGWTTVRLPHGERAPAGLLEGWIEESYRLLVPKSLVAQLPAGGLAGKARPTRKTVAATRTAKKAGAKKVTKKATTAAGAKKAVTKKAPAKKRPRR